MTGTEMTHRPAVALPHQMSQSTAVEQSRAVAEVQAAIVVAQQCPRDLTVAESQMLRSCEQPGLAERAFFRYDRAGSQITGPSVHLARELARCFGNIQYGLKELARDDTRGMSEMLAYAWDVQNNTRSELAFLVPHKRDKKGGATKLVELRDIYENNANMGARRLREAIFAVLPPWFTEAAKERCRQTNVKGDGTPLEKRISDIVKRFEQLGVTVAQLEAKIGRASRRWDGEDVAALIVIGKSLAANETRVEDEFPQAGVTAAAVAEQAEGARAAKSASEDRPDLLLVKQFVTALAIPDSDVPDVLAAILANGTRVDGVENLTPGEASVVLERLRQLGEDPEPAKAVDALLAAHEINQSGDGS